MKSLNNFINEAYASSVKSPKWTSSTTDDVTTLSKDGVENGYEYVDLGLKSGTMWATCNVGSKSPEDPGLLFQWGRVDGYRYNDKRNKFKTADQNNKETNNICIPKTATGKFYHEDDTLYMSDDAAHVNMGGEWRIPTCNEMDELMNSTTHKIITINGIKGMIFTSKTNNKELFIPFDGYWDDENKDEKHHFYGMNVCAQLLSTDLYDAERANVMYLYDKYCTFEQTARACACSVRAVFNK